MSLNLSILYRGPLASCNYDCGYCPFGKQRDSAEELETDRRCLERFVNWVGDRPAEDRLGILFTPWGEALIRRWYQEAIVRLTALPQMVKVAIQTNLSCGLDWIDGCDLRKLGLWTTYHPGETTRARFLMKCQELHRRGVRFSVGVVGLRDHFAEIEALRVELPADVYLWVNAFKDVADYYRQGEAEWLSAIDPLFPINNVRHPSLGHACRAGHTVISVDGDGTVRRCHFIKTPLGNLYDADFTSILRERLCTNETCGCHIGYVHLPHLQLYEVFGDGLLERIVTLR